MKGGARRVGRVLVFVPLLLLAARNARGDFSAFPFYHSQESPTTGTYSVWSPWPFVEATRTTDTLTYGLHPLFSWFKNDTTQQSDLHIVWPFLRRTFRPTTFKGENWRVLYLFPILYLGRGEQEGNSVIARYLLPIYYQGREGPGRHHIIVFPFFWYARDARLTWPLFPSRPQTFAALWPLFGDFRGYWNRDRITFVFWPLFVRSQKGRGPDAFYIHSFLWPIFSLYAGEGYSGFRVWPLYSTVTKKDQFHRSYWLWPLGHRRTGLAADGKTTQTMTIFLPFFANVKKGNMEWKFVFPFYGRFQVGKRTSKGYFLAIYNVEHDERTGIRERRWFWFVYRSRTRTPPPDELTQRGGAWQIFPAATGPRNGGDPSNEDAATTGLLASLQNALSSPDEKEAKKDDLKTGWALFPLYGKMSSATRIRSFMLWPFYTHNWDRAAEFEFDRRYLVPFYSSQERRWNDRAISRSRFFFPFFKSSIRRDGTQHRHWLHLWWYDQLDGIDRNYAPLWTFYEKNWNELTGQKSVRVMKGLYESDHRRDGWTRKAFNLLVFSTRKTPEKTDTTFLWGLFGYHRTEETSKVQVFWFLKF